MRVISGKYGGRQIKPPGNFRARPTTDLAKEGLFNILSNYIDFEGICVLDLFAGTGGIGLEFISRGAASCDMVEKNFRHYKFICSVIEKLNITNVKPVKDDVFKFLLKNNKTYDIIFADPPYDLKNLEKLPELVSSARLLNTLGWFILEHSGEFNFSNKPGFKNLRKYGSVHFSFFQFPQG